MTQPKTLLGLGLGLVTLAATAAAEPGRGSHQLEAGAFLGGNLLGSGIELGDSYFDDQVPGSAMLLGLRGSYLLVPQLMPGSPAAPALAVELEAKLALSSTRGRAEAMRASYAAPILGWRAHAILSIWRTRTLRPFALAGLGGETMFTSSPFAQSVDTDAALHWGLGATYQIGPRLGVRGDLRHGVTAGRVDLTSSTLEIHVGLTYALELPRPTKPTPTVVMEPIGDAAPAGPVDSDGDGIPDDVDRCPFEPEQLNGIDDEDGCPDEDGDNDGVLGSRDQCPDEPEDIDGFQDDDGCPDDDDDGDGRPDVIDACPQEPETLNGFQDDDGCPDEIPPQVVELTGVIPAIKFRASTAILDRSSFAVLDRVVALLKAHPSVRLHISGHTDDRGVAGTNLLLSRSRAEAVRRYLIDRGIAAERLEATGHGAEQPIADNKTAAGRAQNRRIELALVPGPARIPDPRRVPESPESDSDSDSDSGSDAAPAPAPDSGAP